MPHTNQLPLSGFTVAEIGGGAAGAYCCRLLRDAGAVVYSTCATEAKRYAGIVRSAHPLEFAYSQYLAAGKEHHPASLSSAVLGADCSDVDLVILGEDCGVDIDAVRPRVATIALSWFGQQGEYRDWRGSDLVIQALTGMAHLTGTVDGPPLGAGDRHSVAVGGVTAYIAAAAALLAHLDRGVNRPSVGRQRFEVSILEANMALSEMHMAATLRDGKQMPRSGINRYAPMCPVGIYPCKVGWVGITITTPDQWRALCRTLDLTEFAGDAEMVTREKRFLRIDDVEIALRRALAARPAQEWAALGLANRIPLVVVPDAEGILSHDIFRARESLATATIGGRPIRVPRTPFGLEATPTRIDLDERSDDPPARMRSAASSRPSSPTEDGADARPLAGVMIVDFAMGWAGPLATRLLSDLGAEVVKIEAGKYPDWWRGTNWTPEFIDAKDYERSPIFTTMNRGKQGISIDLTSPEGRAIALSLIDLADAVVENQASGVMKKFGLDWSVLQGRASNPVMLSMSAFGTGNALSETRAYGSTLEQASGLPSFLGEEGSPPTMAHQAYGDPIGGLYACSAVLTALVHRKRTGQGQYVNLSIVETVLQFTTPALLEHQLLGRAVRRGNRSHAFVHQGVYRCRGDDSWIAVSVADGASLASLMQLLGRQDLSLATRIAQDPPDASNAADELDRALADWTKTLPAADAAQLLQDRCIAAAPVLQVGQVPTSAHLGSAGFFLDVDREVSGTQRQADIAIRHGGRRLAPTRAAPLLGEHTWKVLQRHLDMPRDRYDELVSQEIITFTPKPTKNLVKG